MRTKTKPGRRSEERARRSRLFERLRLQSEILCDTHEDGKQNVILSRMMRIILEAKGAKLNGETRQALADHFADSVYDRGTTNTVELGGPFERNLLHLAGSFDIGDLAKRIVWTEERHGETIEA